MGRSKDMARVCGYEFWADYATNPPANSESAKERQLEEAQAAVRDAYTECMKNQFYNCRNLKGRAEMAGLWKMSPEEMNKELRVGLGSSAGKYRRK